MAGEEGSIGGSGGFNEEPKTREWGLWGPGSSSKKGNSPSGILGNGMSCVSKVIRKYSHLLF